VYVLTGFLGIGENPWQRQGFGEALHERMDRLIAQGDCEPMILVTPDCFTALGGSQYVDSPAVGRYESFVIDEVVPFVDAKYRTLDEPAHRGVCGKSSGGYGALMLGMKHPDVFGALASHSGDAYFDYCYRFDFVKCWDALRGAGGLTPWLEAFRKKQKLSGSDVHALNIVAMSAAYSPDPDEPHGLKLPFDMETGRELPEVMRRWRRHDPVVECKRFADNLRGMRGVFIDCGLRDEWALHVGARILSERFHELDIEHVHEEFDDGHRSISYRYDRSLPFLSRVLAP
jgi:S-formylglutathione hydrolase FrmB